MITFQRLLFLVFPLVFLISCANQPVTLETLTKKLSNYQSSYGTRYEDTVLNISNALITRFGSISNITFNSSGKNEDYSRRTEIYFSNTVSFQIGNKGDIQYCEMILPAESISDAFNKLRSYNPLISDMFIDKPLYLTNNSIVSVTNNEGIILVSRMIRKDYNSRSINYLYLDEIRIAQLSNGLFRINLTTLE